MYYCVRCGDPISQGEMICDKCGYRFTFVEGTNIPTEAAARSGQPSAQGKPVTNATVYMQPVVRTAAQSRPGAVPPPVSKAGNANTAAVPPAGNAVKAPVK